MKTYKEIKEKFEMIAEASYGGEIPFIASYLQTPDAFDNYATLPPQLRRSIDRLKQQKSKDQSVVFSKDRGEAKLISKDELETHIKHGYEVIFEEMGTGAIANAAKTDAPYTNTDGKFDRVGGFNKVLMGNPRFNVPNRLFSQLKKKKKRKFGRFEEELPAEVKNYSLRNPIRPVVIQDEDSGELSLYRRRYNDQRLRHNRRN